MPSQPNQSMDTGKHITSLADIKKTTAKEDTFANLNNTSLHVQFQSWQLQYEQSLYGYLQIFHRFHLNSKPEILEEIDRLTDHILFCCKFTLRSQFSLTLIEVWSRLCRLHPSPQQMVRSQIDIRLPLRPWKHLSYIDFFFLPVYLIALEVH